jgi:hypothetical protein
MTVRDRIRRLPLGQPPRYEAPEPLEGPVVATAIGGTLIWFALFLVQLPFYGWFADHGHAWWVWTCLAGGGLGIVGVWYVRRREAAIKRAAAGRGTPDGGTGRGTVDGGTSGGT